MSGLGTSFLWVFGFPVMELCKYFLNFTLEREAMEEGFRRAGLFSWLHSLHWLLTVCISGRLLVQGGSRLTKSLNLIFQKLCLMEKCFVCLSSQRAVQPHQPRKSSGDTVLLAANVSRIALPGSKKPASHQ